MLCKLLSAFDHSAFESYVLPLIPGGALRREIDALDVPVLELKPSGMTAAPAAFASLLRSLARLKPDLIQGWMYHGNLAATLAGTILRRPVIWGVHATSVRMLQQSNWTSAVVIKLGAMLSAQPQSIIYVANSSAQEHLDVGYTSPRSTIIPNGFDCTEFLPNLGARKAVRLQLGLSPDTHLVGIVARYHPMKDHDTFLQSAHLLNRPDTHFLMIGPELDRRNTAILSKISQLALEKHVHLLGERSDIAQLLPAFDVFSLSSAWGEAFPLAVGEAMACGIPCVVTNVGDSAYLVQNTGIVVPARDPKEMAGAWRRLLDNPDLRTSLGTHARNRILERFSLPAVARQYEKLYRQVALGEFATSEGHVAEH